MKKRISLLLLAILPLTATYAQNKKDSTLNRTVVVENEYNPHIMDASKINVLPKVDEPAVAKKGAVYATDLRPVSAWTYDNMSPINREWTADPAKRGYLRAGYGTLNNVDLKAGYIADFGEKDRLKANLSLDGWNGTLDNRYVEDWNSRSYRTDIGLDYSHDFSKARFELGGGFGSHVFNYMTAPDAAAITDKHNHTTGNIHLALSSRDSSRPVQFRVQTGLKFFDVKYPLWGVPADDKASETAVHTEIDVWKRSGFGVHFDMDNLLYSDNARQDSYTLFHLNPYYSLQRGDWHLRIGAHISLNTQDASIDGEDDNDDLGIAPDVKVEYTFADDYVLYAQATGESVVNDYRRLSSLSPYWMDGPYKVTHTPLNASIGLKASPADGMWFNVFGGYRICNEELAADLDHSQGMYYTDFVQDKTKTAYVGAELKYEYKDVFKVSLNGTYYNWKTDYQPEWAFLLSKPELEVNFFAEAKVLDALKVNVGYEFAKRPNEEVVGGINPNLENVNNLSIGANYTLLKDISLFARINNLLNSEYYLTSGYPAQKLSAQVGVALQF